MTKLEKLDFVTFLLTKMYNNINMVGVILDSLYREGSNEHRTIRALEATMDNLIPILVNDLRERLRELTKNSTTTLPTETTKCWQAYDYVEKAANVIIEQIKEGVDTEDLLSDRVLTYLREAATLWRSNG